MEKRERPPALDPTQTRVEADAEVEREPAGERRRTDEALRWRLSGGTEGVAPGARIATERREVIGTAAARILRKASGAARSGGVEIPQSGGVPLPDEVRARMQPQLGANLSGVRVHTGGASGEAAAKLGAKAFTVGSDVHFGAGQFAPGSKEGDKLIAHELTHVAQGGGKAVHRKADAEEKEEGPEVSHPDEPAEREADATSEKVADALHGDDKKSDEKRGDEEKKPGAKPDKKASDEKVHAKLEDGKVWLAVDPNDRQYQNWLRKVRKVKLGNPASETNQSDSKAA
jgi:hypothetical protein